MRINPIDPIYRAKPRKKRNRAEEESPWFKYGTDEDYKAFCRKKPSAYSGKNINIVYAHYRTAENSGIGIKPVYSGIPLTTNEHFLQHSVGQFHFMERERWEYLVDKHLRMWADDKSKKA